MSLTSWIAAVAAGLVASAALYLGRRGPATRPPRALAAPAVLRAAAVALLVALLLDIPVGRPPAARRVTVLDASLSWVRGGDTATWLDARRRAGDGAGELWLAGDSARAGPAPARPTDRASSLRAAVERAASSGRPVTVVSDGELSDPEILDALPAGSRVELLRPRRGPDAALTAVESPPTAAVGDSLLVRVSVAADTAGSPARTLTARLGGGALARAAVPPLSSHGEQVIELRVPGAPAPGGSLLVVALGGPGDVEPRNDTLALAVEVTATPAAVFVSTAPDFDARYALEVLRGSLSLPATAYFRVAPGAWRDDRTFAPVAESAVRAALRAAPVAALHGDTAYFGAPRAATTGALVLVPRIDDRGEEWYAVAAPPSPLRGALSGTPWDSLPPVGLATVPPTGDWTALSVRQARDGVARAAVAGSEASRRVAVVGASGLWRWRFRGGVSADAFAALWGGIFDWLAEGRTDRRAAVPAGPVRAGEVVRWRRGAGDSAAVELTLARRGATGDTIRVALRFAPGTSVAESAPLDAGVYDVRAPGGSSVLVVSPSAEWLPRRAAAPSAAPIPAAALGPGPLGLRAQPWAYVAVLALLCLEWLLRRRLSLS